MDSGVAGLQLLQSYSCIPLQIGLESTELLASAVDIPSEANCQS